MPSTSYPFDSYSLRSSLLYVIFNNTSSFRPDELLTVEERHLFYKKLLSMGQYKIEDGVIVNAHVDNRALLLVYTRSLNDFSLMTGKELNLFLKAQDIFMKSEKHKQLFNALC